MPRKDAWAYQPALVLLSGDPHQRQKVLRAFSVLSEVFNVWRRQPELRLGQLLDDARDAAPGGRALYFISDKDLVTGLRLIGPVRGTGRRTRLKPGRSKELEGSIPSGPTKKRRKKK